MVVLKYQQVIFDPLESLEEAEIVNNQLHNQPTKSTFFIWYRAQLLCINNAFHVLRIFLHIHSQLLLVWSPDII